MRKTCIVCGAPVFAEPLMNCKSMPKAAQHFPHEDEVSGDFPIDLHLMQCSGCGLIQLDTDAVDYYRDVIRSGGYSTTMHKLRHEQYRRFLDFCPLTDKKIIEVGCGRGEFLRLWREDGFPVKAFGIEHDRLLAQKAREDQLDVETGFAENGETRLQNAPFDGFCSFNFLEHQPDPNGMLQCIHNNLRDEAYGLITVPAWEYILEQNSYYELIRDHIAYYSRESFSFLLEKNGFRVLSMRMVNRDTWEAIVEKKQKTNLADMICTQKYLQEEISDLVKKLKAAQKKLAVWGASHQGLTILSSTALGTYASYVIDSAPFKQGLYTMGSHLKIVSPVTIKEKPVQAILIVAPGYTEEISETIRTKFDSSIQIYALRSNHLERIESTGENQ